MASTLHQNHLFIVEDDKGQRHFTLKNSVYTIGREPKCDICLVSQFVSRGHAILRKLSNDDGSHYYRIEDGDLHGKPSVNGLLINGHKLQGHNLQNKDVVVFGPKVRAIYFLLKDDALATLGAEDLDTPEFDVTLIDPRMVAVDSED